jgi:DNA-binding MarR family transcriptional regulator
VSTPETSRDDETSRDELIAAIVRATTELGTARGAHSQAVAGRLGLAAADVDVLRALAAEGPMAVGRIGELTSLTTGATTRMVDRLEQAGYVRRVPDPADRRRVIVAPVPERVAQVTAAFDPIDEAARDVLADHAPDALRDVLGYLEACLAALREAAGTAREPGSAADAPAGAGAVAAPVASATAGRLVFVTGAPRVNITADAGLGAELYRARFNGAVPSARVRDGVVTIRFPRFAWFDWRVRVGDNRLEASTHWRPDTTDVVLNAALPWRVEFRGGATSVSADLRGVRLQALELSGGSGAMSLKVGQPVGVVPIRVSGGAHDLSITRPAGAAVRMAVSGGYRSASLDGVQAWSGGRIASSGADDAPDRYEITVSGGATRVTVTPA